MDRPLYAYAYAEVPFDDAIAMLASDPEGLLQSATESSVEQAGEVVSNLRLEVGGFDLGRDVTIELGRFDPVEQLRAVVPISWRASAGHHLFPTLDASLEVAALSLQPPVVQVTVAGMYEPPMGLLGSVLDRTVLHRVAESVIHRFVHEVAERLEQRLAELALDEVVATAV